jgi:c-di-GMP-binding flagellar brake protein YcgR
MTHTQKRIDVRYDFPSTIEYVMGAQENDGSVHKGVTIDLSPAGLGMYIFDLLPNGQQITIKSPLPVDSRTATICWTSKKGEGFYRSGLKFT